MRSAALFAQKIAICAAGKCCIQHSAAVRFCRGKSVAYQFCEGLFRYWVRINFLPTVGRGPLHQRNSRQRLASFVGRKNGPVQFASQLQGHRGFASPNAAHDDQGQWLRVTHGVLQSQLKITRRDFFMFC